MGGLDFVGYSAATDSWNTLAELKAVALAMGCSPAKFARAVEVLGENPPAVANYLQRHLFVAEIAKLRRPAK